MPVFLLDEQVQTYKRSKDAVQNLSGVRMLAHAPIVMKVVFTNISGHDVRLGVLTGYPSMLTYPNNGNRALNMHV